MNPFFKKISLPIRGRSGGFTLIEILVVMAIIGILLSIAIPAIIGVLNTAKRAKDKTNAVGVKTAVSAYVTDYGVLPAPNATANADTMYGPAMGTTPTSPGANTNYLFEGLCGNVNVYSGAIVPSTTTTINTRNVPYLTLQKSAVDINGILIQQFTLSGSNQYFTVLLDTNYDNSLANCPNPSYSSTSSTNNTTTITVIDNCAIWCNNDQLYSSSPNSRWSATY